MATPTDYLKLHFIVFLWGFTAVVGKLILLPSAELVFYRTLLAAVGMGLWIIAYRGNFRVNGADLIKLFLTGVIVAVHWLAFFYSGRISNLSTSLVGFATCSLWAALIDPLVKARKIHAVEIGLGLLVLAGLAIIFSFDFQYKFGLFLGVLSGLAAALFSIINSRLVTRLDAYAITFYEMTGACLAVVLLVPLYAENGWADLSHNPSWQDWLYLLFMAVGCSIYAFSVSIELSKRITVFLIQLTLNLEPVYGILIALLVFGQQEVMNFNFYAGTAIILFAVISYPFLKRTFDQRSLSSGEHS